MSALLRYISQQAWAVHEPVLRRGLEVVERHIRGERMAAEDVARIVDERDAARMAAGRPEGSKAGDAGYYLAGKTQSVAVVPVEGLICKYASMINGQSQPEGTTTGAIIDSLRAARADTRVRSLLLDIDSPGGTVPGVHEVAAEIRGVAAEIPVAALSRDSMCSGAYFIGSQAPRVWVTPMGWAGSVGVYTVLEDSSRFHESRGFRFVLVKAGAHKASCVEGLPITEDAVAVVQAQIDAIYRSFVETALVGGRRMRAARAYELADGRVHMGQDAVTLGLADGVRTFEGAVAELEAAAAAGNGTLNGSPSPASGRGGNGASTRTEHSTMTLAELKAAHPELMAAHETEVRAAARVEFDREALAAAPKPATVAQLKAEFPGDGNAAFRENCLEGSMTMDQAKGAYAAELKKQHAAVTAERDTLKTRVTELTSLGGAGLGTGPVGGSPGAGGSGAGTFEDSVRAIAAADKVPVAQACFRAARKPELAAAHADWMKRGCPTIKAA